MNHLERFDSSFRQPHDLVEHACPVGNIVSLVKVSFRLWSFKCAWLSICIMCGIIGNAAFSKLELCCLIPIQIFCCSNHIPKLVGCCQTLC